MKLGDLHPQRGLTRWLVRLPRCLYQARLGWLLGRRFLMLTHQGRKTGLARQTVLEVVHYDKTTGRFIVASGWGKKSDWFQNIQQTPLATVTCMNSKTQVVANQLTESEAEQVLTEYAAQHPLAFRGLVRLITGAKRASVEDDVRALSKTIPLVSLNPLNARDSDDEKSKRKG